MALLSTLALGFILGVINWLALDITENQPLRFLAVIVLAVIEWGLIWLRDRALHKSYIE